MRRTPSELARAPGQGDEPEAPQPPRIGPGPVPVEALRYFKRKKITPAFDYRTVWGEEHREAFSVARAVKASIVKSLKGSLAKALENGETFEEWKKNAGAELDKLGWTPHGKKATPSRLRFIYDTNMRQARNAGQWQRIERTRDVLPNMIYELGPSERHRPEHAAWAGTILPITDTFWTTHMPQNGHGCKCRVRQLSTFETTKRGGLSERPDTTLVEVKDPRNGGTTFVPRGIEPGFAYNPGMRPRGA